MECKFILGQFVRHVESGGIYQILVTPRSNHLWEPTGESVYEYFDPDNPLKVWVRAKSRMEERFEAVEKDVKDNMIQSVKFKIPFASKASEDLLGDIRDDLCLADCDPGLGELATATFEVDAKEAAEDTIEYIKDVNLKLAELNKKLLAGKPIVQEP